MRENALKQVYKTIDAGTADEKMAALPKFPKIIELEITNHCNFKCIMCPTGIGTAKRARGYMDDTVYQKLIEEVASELRCIPDGPGIAVKFVGQGEPLLHPRAIEYIAYAHEHGLITHLTTNGSLLSDDMIKRIVDEQILDSVKFSFQGIDPQGYLTLRQKDGFDELIDRISTMYMIRADHPKPYMTIGTSITSENSERVDRFISMAGEICDKVEVGMTQLEASELTLVRDDSVRRKLIELQSRQKSDKRRYVCCPQVFDVITVRWNGDISACCADINGDMTLGNLNDTSLSECWNGERENAFRSILAQGRYEDIIACKDCYDVYGWTYGEN